MKYRYFKHFSDLDTCLGMERLVTLAAIALILIGYHFGPSQQNSNIAYNIPDPGKCIPTPFRVNEVSLI